MILLVKAHAITETIMEHIATAAGLDPLQFRMDNFLSPGDELVSSGGSFEGPNPLVDMINELKTNCDYEARVQAVQAFNSANAWIKRGITITPMRWEHVYGTGGTARFVVQIAIYHNTGTVSLSTGGVEMGQGINTKAVQVVAKELGIDIGLIQVKTTNNFVSNNNGITGGSMGSDLVCSASVIAARALRDRMKVIEDTMNNPTWQELVTECYNAGMDLTERHM